MMERSGKTNAMLAAASIAVLSLAFAPPAIADSASATPTSAAVPEVLNLAQMTAGYTYYNRPGADAALQASDLADCVAAASTTRSMDEITGNGQANGLLGAMLGNAISSAYRHGTVGSGIENCMVAREWRVVHLDDTEGAALAALPQADLAAKLGPWVAADTPHGQVVRVWRNDFAHASIGRFAMRPGHTNDGNLSLKAVTGKTLPDVPSVPPAPYPKVKLDAAWAKNRIRPDHIVNAPPGSAIILVQVRGTGMHNGMEMSFARIGDEKTPFPSVADSRPDVFPAGFNGAFASNKFWTTVFVPPGRWRIATFGLMPTANMCLGSPSFEAKAGEVIYAGTFDFGAEEMGPNLDVSPAKEFLKGTPAADQVKPAIYVNGSTSPCGDSSIYALDIPGAPFEAGYRWRHQATAQATNASPQIQ